MTVQTIQVDGKSYVLLPSEEYDTLQLKASAAELPPLPAPLPNGRVAAIPYARASLARKLILSRVEAGLTREELARRARIRVETLCCAESGKYTPAVGTVDKIDRALKQAAKRNGRKRSK